MICRTLRIGRATAYRSTKGRPKRYRRRADEIVVAQLRQALGLGQPSLDVFGGVGQHSLFLLERLGLVGRNRCRRAAGQPFHDE